MREHHKFALERMRKQILKEMQEVLIKYYDHPIDSDGDLLKQIEEETRSRMAAIITAEGYNDRNDIAFVVEQDKLNIDRVIFQPGNLFTTLLFHGIYVPPRMLGEEKYETDHGTYHFREGKAYFQPPMVLENIIVNLTIKPDGEILDGPSEQESQG